VTLRLTPARFALSYISLGVIALALLAVPLWYGFQANLGTFRSYIPAAEMQRFVDIFHRDGPKAVAAAVDAYAKTLPPDQVTLFVDPQRQRLAGNLPHWPAGVPDAPGTYGLVIERGGKAPTRVVVAHVGLPDGYVLLMGRESVIFDSLVARFWFGIAGAIAILLSLGLLFGWLLRRAHGQLEALVEQRTAQLQLSEERYALAMQASGEGHWDWKIGTDEYYTSPRHLEILGLPPGTTSKARAEALQRIPYHPEDRARYDAAVADHFAGRTPRVDIQVRLVVRGELRWVHAIGMCLRDAAGTPVRYAGSIMDITERKRVEEALRESEKRYERAMFAAEAGFWEWIVASDEFYASPRMRTICGLPPDAVFRSRADFLSLCPFHPEDLALWRKAVAAHLAGETARIDLEVRAKVQRETRWIHIAAICLRNASGAEERWTGSVSDVTERRRAQEALRLSEERYARAMEGSDAGHWDWNIVSDEMFLSERAREMLALPPGALPMRRSEILELIPAHPDDRANLAEMVNAALRSGVLAHDYRVIPAPGQVRWLRVRAKIYHDARGAAVRMTGSLIDITERKLAGDALRTSEQRYSLAMEASEEGHFDIRYDIKEQFYSDRLLELVGIPPGTHFSSRAEALKVLRFFSDSDAELYLATIRSVEARNGPNRYEFEFRITLPSGEMRWLRTRGKITRDSEGNIQRRTGVAADITERKLAADALRASEERFRSLTELSNDFFWETDTEHRYTVLDFGLIHRGQHEKWKKLGKRPWEIPSTSPDEAGWAALRATIDERKPFVDFAMSRVDRGEERFYEISGEPRFHADGTFLGYRGVGRETTARVRAEQELRAMERKLRQAQRLEAMGTLAGGIAHDFNNILGAILGFGEMAMRDAAKGSRLWRDLDCILEAGERGRALVDRVLAFSRSSVGERVAVHVEKVVRETLDQLSAKLPPDITLHAKLHSGRAAMKGDATQVHQVAMNLATNAIQAMPGGGTLRVSLRVERIEEARAPTIGSLAPAEYIVLQVADTGTGIAADVLERMFDPFFTTKEVGTGTGLGLSIVHGIVTAVGGAIDVASKVGAGSTFTIYLPRAGDAVEADPDEKLSPPRGDGQRVLVVDDEEPLVKLATRTLKELGYSPVGFTSSRAALAAFRADPHRFDALITDERMPGMSGSALIRKVRGIRDSLPVVLMSGYVGDAVARQAREAGAAEVLRKPLSAQELATSLARVLHG
jgi:PAS domain S-box-containing protein